MTVAELLKNTQQQRRDCGPKACRNLLLSNDRKRGRSRFGIKSVGAFSISTEITFNFVDVTTP
jgi:hypothetical protein